MPIKRKPDEHKVDNFIALLNFIADPVIIVDETGHFLLMNKAYEEATGYKNDEYRGKSSLATKGLAPRDKKLVKENLKKRATGLYIPPYELTFIAKKKPRFFEINAKKIFFNKQPSVMVIFRDVTIRKQNEQRLKESSAKMKALVNQKVREIKDNAKKIRVYFDASPDAIAVTDQNGRLLDCNDAAIKLFGYSSRAEVIDLNVAGLIPKKELIKIKSFTDKMITTGSFKNQNVVLFTKQGKKFPAELSVSAVKNVYDASMVYITIIKDVSERRQLEEALRESEERFRVMSTAAINAIFLVDDEGKVAYWNPAAEKMFGYTLQEVLGKDINRLLVPPEARISHKKILKQLAHGENKYRGTIDAIALRKDQTIISIEISATGLKLKGKEYALAIIQEVTARKKMENALKQERDLLEKVTENIGAGLGIISKDYHILWANKLLTQAHGDDIENKLCYTIFNKLDHVCENCGVKKIFETNETVNRHDYNFLDKNGNPVCVELIVTPIKDKHGQTVAGLELAIDVTEKRRLEKKLEEYSLRLEKIVEERTKQLRQIQAKLVKSERLAAIGELAAMVGHDLRNPLTGIKAATYYLKGKCMVEEGSKEKEMFQMIDDCIEQSNKIVNDLLEYSRMTRIDVKQVNPKEVILRSLALVKKPENIHVTMDVNDDALVKIDQSKIIRVFTNVIRNAFDAMPDGGSLLIKSILTQTVWDVAFTDSGVGMSRETLGKLGYPLFTTKAKGMGFGIPICKRIVEAHGGKLLIESTLGKGTTITISLPISPKLEEHGASLAVNELELEKTLS